jgi:transposase
LALRARIVLAWEGTQNKEVATRLQIDLATVGKWRRRLSRNASTVCATNPARVRRASSRTRGSQR